MMTEQEFEQLQTQERQLWAIVEQAQAASTQAASAWCPVADKLKREIMRREILAEQQKGQVAA